MKCSPLALFITCNCWKNQWGQFYTQCNDPFEFICKLHLPCSFVVRSFPVAEERYFFYVGKKIVVFIVTEAVEYTPKHCIFQMRPFVLLIRLSLSVHSVMKISTSSVKCTLIHLQGLYLHIFFEFNGTKQANAQMNR